MNAFDVYERINRIWKKFVCVCMTCWRLAEVATPKKVCINTGGMLKESVCRCVICCKLLSCTEGSLG